MLPVFYALLPVFYALLLGCCPAAPLAEAPPDSEGEGFVAEHRSGLDAAGFAVAFDAVLSTGFPLPHIVYADYRELLEHGDGSCPSAGGTEDFDVSQGCTTDEGFSFRGRGGIMVVDTRVYTSGGSWSGAYAQYSNPADYAISRPDGTSLESGGILETLVMQEGGVTTWSARMAGTFLDDGRSDWLGRTFSGEFELSGSGVGSEAEQTVDGELSLDGVAIGFGALELGPASCPDGALGGTVSLRQSDSTWFELTLGEGCGACGALIWDGIEELGEACVDLAPVLDTVAIASVL